MTQEEIQIVKLENKIKTIKKKAITLSIIGILTSMCIGVGIGGIVYNSKYNLTPEMREFIEFYNLFKANYYEEVDDRTLLDGLYYGLTDSVNDDYTFYTSTVNNEYQDLSSSGVGSVGSTVSVGCSSSANACSSFITGASVVAGGAVVYT